MPLLPFEELEEGQPDVRRVFTVRSDRVRSQVSGREARVDRLIAPNWVNVVAVTPGAPGERSLVLVRQWRFGTKSFTLELPAGLVEDGEDPLSAGLRELREETGYASRDPQAPRVIGAVRPNPAFMGNTCTTIFAPDVVVVGEQHLDPTEEIEIVVLPERELDAAIAAGDLSTALGIVGLFWWRRLAMGAP